MHTPTRSQLATCSRSCGTRRTPRPSTELWKVPSLGSLPRQLRFCTMRRPQAWRSLLDISHSCPVSIGVHLAHTGDHQRELLQFCQRTPFLSAAPLRGQWVVSSEWGHAARQLYCFSPCHHFSLFIESGCNAFFRYCRGLLSLKLLLLFISLGIKGGSFCCPTYILM